MALVIISIVLILLFYLKYKESILLYIPLVFLLASFIYPFITDVNSSIEPESNSSTVLLKLFTSGFLFFISLKLILTNYLSRLTRIIFLLITYFFILSLFSSSITTTWTRLLIVGSNILLLPASIIFFQNKHNQRKFFSTLIITNVFAILYIAYASFFKVGAAIYDNEALRYGGFHFFGLYLFVFTFPLIILKLSERINVYYLLILAAQIVILVLSLKRTYLLLIGAFIFLYLITLIIEKKIRFSRIIVFIIALFSLTYFNTTFTKTEESRDKELSSETIEEEGRILEYYIYYDERLENITYKTLFGENLFNNRGEFGINNKYAVNTRERTLHSDYTTLLFGAGIFGIILLLIFYYEILKILKKTWNIMNKLSLSKQHLYLSFSYVIILLISQAIDGLYTFWARGIPFMILGYLIASNKTIIKSYFKKRVMKIEEKI